MLPAIFVSHGAPTLPFDGVPARDFLRGLGQSLPRPRAIVVASAHWETDAPAAGTSSETIHDFYGFPQALYDIRYPAPVDEALARQVADLTGGAVDASRGRDHGAWVPLMLMYPQADIPVVQLSLQTAKGAAGAIALGRQLAPLREAGVLVLGSGGFVHNLRRIAPPGTREAEWSQQFSDWTHDRLMAGDAAALVDYRAQAPHAAIAQPSEEHFLPLFVALGAGGEKPKAARLHSSATLGTLRMDAYSFG